MRFFEGDAEDLRFPDGDHFWITKLHSAMQEFRCDAEGINAIVKAAENR